MNNALKDEFKRTELIRLCANYMIDYDMTVRDLEQELMLGRGTVHRMLTFELKYEDDDLYVQCKKILQRHKKERRRRR